MLDAGLRGDSHGSATAAAVLDGDSFYASAENFDYVLARDLARRRVEREKKNEKAKEAPTEPCIRLKYDEKLQYWSENMVN
ncbi:unnamed protein product [Gongylonema pulchrum]|uniref:Uncharacterized protein n=1 Tax=Gongylonema pulchrum TaxID=637853 RepID=A0A3P7Q2R9_9BILA|nr:unnamed protein product [Gongylonema pulchrum]